MAEDRAGYVGLRVAILGVAVGLVPTWPALAQVTGLEEITVTARKRSESLLEVPLSVSVVSADKIDRAGFKGLEDLAMQVPGLQYHDQGGQRPGRFNSAIRFRGMDVNSPLPTFQLGSLFIDGLYVLGTTHSIPLDDVEQVEVIKGPQSAYFGRNTFGGAINYITRAPSMEDYSGSLQASAGTYQEHDLSASHEGPIIPGRLSYRIGGRSYARGAMWKASDGGGLGEQSTESIYGTLVAKPVDGLTLRLRGFYGRDEDGPPAGAFISGQINDSCSGTTVTAPSGQTARPVNWFCGKVPELGEAVSVLGNRNIIDGVTNIRLPIAVQTTGNADFLRTTLLDAPLDPRLSKVPKIDGIEMRREVSRISLMAEYEFDNGYSLTAQGGTNEMHVNWLRDQTNSGFAQNFSNDPQSQEDKSLELRVTSPQDRRLRWMLGANYYSQEFFAAGGGGAAVFFCWDKLAGSLATSPDCNLARAPFVQLNRLDGSDEVTTTGIFGSVAFDITDRWVLNLEGRYQDDELVKSIATAKYQTFLPRVILQYKPTDRTNLYASWALGVLPGEANSFILNATPFELQQYQALVPGITGITPQEELDSIEIGWKQTAFDGRLSFAAAAYYGEWENLKSRIISVVNETCRTTTQAGCNPAQGGAPIGQPSRTAAGAPQLIPRNNVVSGSATIYGFEFEGSASVNENWSVDVTANLADSELKEFNSTFITSYAGFSDVRGNSLARFPKWSGSLSSTYRGKMGERWEWFARADVSYFGKTFAEVDNLAYCDAYWVSNARAGFERENLRVELWAKNLFSDDSWTACARNTDQARPADLSFFTYYQGVTVSPQNRRQIGIKASVRF